MKIILVVLATLLVLSTAQIPLCFKFRCNGLNQVCGTTDLTTFQITDCKSGLTCVGAGGGNDTGGTCQTDPTLHQSCSVGSAECTDPKYDIDCLGGTCLYLPALGPGESCSSAPVGNYQNGQPCVGASTCTSGTCSGTLVASGASCDNALNACDKGLYCGKGNNGTVCQSRLSAGAACTFSSDCAWNLICTNRGSGNFTCQAPFSQAAGAGCLSELDCVAGTFCDPSALKCTSPSSQNTACTISDTQTEQGSCPNGYSCICRHGSAGSTTGQCAVEVLPKSIVTDLNNFWNCMSTKCPYDISIDPAAHTVVTVAYTPDTCATKQCSGPINSLRNDGKGLANSLGVGCGSGTAISVIAFLLVSLVSVVLMF